VNNELERIWKEVVAKFEIQSWDLLGCTKDNYRKPQSEITCLQAETWTWYLLTVMRTNLIVIFMALEEWHELCIKRW